MSKEKLKIAIDARMINMSGIGTYIQHLMKANIYDVALGNKEEINKFVSDIDVIGYDSKIYGIKEQLKFPYKKLKKLKPDILHIPHYNVPMFYRGRMFVTIHDLTHLVLPELLPNKFAYCYAKFMLWFAAHRSEKIITDSNNTKKDIIKYLKVDSSKISVVHCGVDLQEFKKKAENEYDYLYSKYGISRNKNVIMYVGNLKPHKNLKRLLEAFKDIDEINNTVLVLVGKAFENHNVNEYERQLGIENKVIHTGIVSQTELVDLYNLADLFVFPSLYEGFGIPPLEAMACGTPVVCSNTSSIPEVVNNAAYTFNPMDIDEIKNAVNTILKNKELKKEYVNMGYEQCKKFSWNDCVNLTIDEFMKRG